MNTTEFTENTLSRAIAPFYMRPSNILLHAHVSVFYLDKVRYAGGEEELEETGEMPYTLEAGRGYEVKEPVFLPADDKGKIGKAMSTLQGGKWPSSAMFIRTFSWENTSRNSGGKYHPGWGKWESTNRLVIAGGPVGPEEFAAAPKGQRWYCLTTTWPSSTHRIIIGTKINWEMVQDVRNRAKFALSTHAETLQLAQQI